MSKVYGSAGSSPAIAGLDLEVGPGEYLVLVGPSGSGKSTLLRLVAGLETPSSGTISLDGHDLRHRAPRDRSVAMVFQNPAVYPHLTVRDNLAFGLRARGVKTAEALARVHEVAESLGVGHLLMRFPATLSGGERQRVAVGRALATRPSLFLLDEPLAALDAPLRLEIRGVLADLHKRTGATFLHVTHDQSEALALGSRIGVLNGGRLLQVARPRDVYERPSDRFVGKFVGDPPLSLLDAIIHLGAAGTLLEIAGIPATVPLPRGLSSWPVGPIQMGVRPEDVDIVPAVANNRPAGPLTRLPGEHVVVSSEYAGRSKVVVVEIGAGKMTAVAHADCPVATGERVGVFLNLGRASWFDPVSGRARNLDWVADPGDRG